MATLSLKSVTKSYGTAQAVRGIDLEIPDHAFVVFVGPSGCGKSTTLRMIAGLEDISTGTVEIDGRPVNHLAPAERDIAMVFQNYALYPHMSVRDNIAFGLQQRKMPKAEIAERVQKISDMLELSALLDRKPRQLSGGQRQRVAMGRAMVRDPAVFLYDEPLSNLDAKLRVQMRTEIKRLHQVAPTTTIYVTHDQTEAMTLADIVVVMKDGLIEQVGTPQELYFHPRTAFVAQFVGSPSMNLIQAQVTGSAEAPQLELSDGTLLPVLPERIPAYGAHLGRTMTFGVRPEDLLLAEEGAPGFGITIDLIEPLGQEILAFFKIDGQSCAMRLDPMSEVRPGDRLTVTPRLERCHLLDPETDLVVAHAATPTTESASQ
ncbi:carbohydrate ABC transporter ATP-binding protein (CUT1 family) [Rhodobacter aestuarii]|uniref:Carbohydrate ABC transporter ATP-binding protein, CUT1 family n=1 Tax=Rhodobacter aestuarii TaxID=453582 RepID=A0A1N7JUP3_9RHOB|nr:sn-glycerol-3-phosphate ABC transporter ATP-binding protein UgpC [Rhodobacter aestuarii]PTV95986.1 carbohydrate ABC transporter ATP-binding protein (CUT1 family) [Rhodobacter aestuarii]SIS52924.1 carbohydrate ABC transporter ATP-binding protein, CUT1 family [Rhodobacter aestuarii]